MTYLTDGVFDALTEVSQEEAELHESLRRSHCDHKYSNDPSHKCVGTTTIGPKGTTLSCPLCGTCPLEMRHHDPPSTEAHLGKLTRSMSKSLLRVIQASDDLEVAITESERGL